MGLVRKNCYESGYTRTGPYSMVCKVCGQKISTNALARAGHERGKRHQAAIEAENVADEEAEAQKIREFLDERREKKVP